MRPLRTCTSAVPSDTVFLPTVTRTGAPISSASANSTPGLAHGRRRAPSRPSRRARPGVAGDRELLGLGGRRSRPGARRTARSLAGQMMPFSSWRCSTAAARCGPGRCRRSPSRSGAPCRPRRGRSRSAAPSSACPSLKMLPTSIAGSMLSAPLPQYGAGVAGLDLAEVGELGLRSRGPASTPRRCQPVRFAPPTNWPVAQRLVGDRSRTSAPTGADRARVGAERRPDLVRLGGPERRRRARFVHLQLVQAVVAADEREHDLAARRRSASPSPSPPGRCRGTRPGPRSSSMPGVSTSSRRVQAASGTPARAASSAPPRRSRRSRSSSTAHELVLAVRARGDELLAAVAAHHADVGLDHARPRGRSARRCGRRRRGARRSDSSSPARSRSKL